MKKTKNHELEKEFDFEKSRRITPEEQEIFRRGIEKKLGISLPKLGRPRKSTDDKYAPIFIRLHPKVISWAKKQAKKKSIGYQTVINQALLSMANNK